MAKQPIQMLPMAFPMTMAYCYGGHTNRGRNVIYSYPGPAIYAHH